MTNQDRLRVLREQHAQLEHEIKTMLSNGGFTEDKLQEKKIRKLRIKDEISQLQRTIFEETHNRVEFDEGY